MRVLIVSWVFWGLGGRCNIPDWSSSVAELENLIVCYSLEEEWECYMGQSTGFLV